MLAQDIMDTILSGRRGLSKVLYAAPPGHFGGITRSATVNKEPPSPWYLISDNAM